MVSNRPKTMSHISSRKRKIHTQPSLFAITEVLRKNFTGLGAYSVKCISINILNKILQMAVPTTGDYNQRVVKFFVMQSCCCLCWFSIKIKGTNFISKYAQVQKKRLNGKMPRPFFIFRFRMYF